MKRNLLFVAALALLAGCSSGTTTPPLTLPTAAQLRVVPTSLGVFGKTLKGTTYIWRDLMPVAISPGESAPKTGIMVSFTVKTEDNAAVPGGLIAERITVAYGDEVWTSTDVEVQSDANSFGGIVRNGPELPGGTTLDAVIYFRDSAGGTYELRAPGKVVNVVY